jgi:hypothetical protein
MGEPSGADGTEYKCVLLVRKLAGVRPDGRVRRRGMIILEWIMGKSGLDSAGSGWEPVARYCEDSNARHFV